MPKKSKRKMTVKHEEPESEEESATVATEDQILDNMEVDEDEGTVGGGRGGGMSSDELLQMMEDDSLKLVKNVVRRGKELCKFLVASSPGGENLGMAKLLSEKINIICGKYRKSTEKAGKFVSKVFEDESLSCESDFFRTLLKYGMNAGTNPESGSAMIAILQGVISVGAYAGKVENPTLGIQMIVSHSSAADIFLESHQFVKNINPNKKSGQGGDSQPDEKYSEIKTQLLKLWRNLVVAFTKISKTSGTPADKKILENSIPYMFQMYSGTMSEADQEIFQILQEYAGKRLQLPIESMPLFGPKCFEPAATNPKASNPLFAHSSKANTILGLINERQAFQTAMEYREGEGHEANPKHYDIRFMLPLLCHVLDARNICDAVKVIGHGWIYLVVRGLSLEDDVMRRLSFLAYKLLIQNFQLPKKGYKMQDIKVWLHFLLSVRKGMQTLGRCKISNLLSTWMVASWEVIRQPAHPMYQRLTTLLFAKPTIDLNVVPDFLPFYNATDGNRATREWILNILSHGLHTREDWQVAQKLPTINSLCSSFLVEKVLVQRQILKILHGGAGIHEIAQEMVDKHSLLIWIANVSMNKKQIYVKELQDLFRTLRQNCPENESRQLLFQYVTNVHGWSD